MSRAALAVVLALGGGTMHAAAAPTPPVTWSDWVGAYDGKLTWHGCITPGARTATLAVEATDAVVSIDLAPASPGLRTMSLVADDRGWSGQQGDVKVQIARPRADALALVVELDSGCTVKGQLRRKATGIAACDRLLGWTRIESRCTKLQDAPLEDLAKLVATRWQRADADRCTARVAKLEAALVDAGCAPHPDPRIGVRAPECLALATASAKLSRCGNVPAQIKDAIAFEAAALSSASQSAERATLPYVEQQCRDVTSTIATVATQFSCP